jgi:hypothetical protein
MNVSTAKISDLLYDAGTSRFNSEVRSAALFWFISFLGTALLAFIVLQLGITPA